MPNNPTPVIALDGPSGSGKGTVAQALAVQLGWHYLESGALYRVLGWLAAQKGIALNDAESLAKLASELSLTFRDGAVFLDGDNVEHDIRSEAAGERASRVAPLPAVRAALLVWQRACARPPGLVADGRDMGSVVFPDAACKIYLTADINARAKRRYSQLKARGFDVTIADLARDLAERDRRDSNREASPLHHAADALMLDTTALSIDGSDECGEPRSASETWCRCEVVAINLNLKRGCPTQGNCAGVN